MMNRWQHAQSARPLIVEADVMAATLEAQHGLYAAEIAEFLSNFHTVEGNEERAFAWAEVADAVRDRMSERVRS